MAEPLRAGDVAATLSELASGDVTAGQLRNVIANGRALVRTLFPIIGEPYEGAVGDWWRMEQVFQAAEEAIADLPDSETIPRGSEAWRMSVGPIMAGLCYGPPACSAAVVEQSGGEFRIAPWGAQPWVMMGASEAADLAAEHAWAELTQDLVRPVKQTAGALMSLAKVAAIGFVAWWLLSDER